MAPNIEWSAPITRETWLESGKQAGSEQYPPLNNTVVILSQDNALWLEEDYGSV